MPSFAVFALEEQLLQLALERQALEEPASARTAPRA